MLAGRHPRQQSRVIANTLGHSLGATQSSRSTQSPQSNPTSVANSQHEFDPAATTVLQHDFEADFEMLEQLAVSTQTLAPIVGLETADRPSSILLDITNLDPLYDGETNLLCKVAQHFRGAGYFARAAIADTISVAWGLAHFENEQLSIAPKGDQLEPLTSLPIQSLRLSPETCETLRQLGIDYIDQLLKLPRASLTARFGDEINLRLDQANGTVREVFKFIHTPENYHTQELLQWPVKDIATTIVIIERAVDKLCQQMQTNARGGLQWQIRLFRQEATPITLDIKLFQPTTTAAHVMQLVEMQLDQHPEFRQLSMHGKDNFCRQSPITEVNVGVTNCVQLGERQRKLFDEDPSHARLELAQLVNRLTSRLGQEQVSQVVLQSGAQPEFSFRLKPLVDATRRRKSKNTPRSHYVMARPLRLHNPAVPLIPVHPPCPANKNLPNTFRTPGQQVLQITQNWGPERIETGWWRGKTVCRDYWRVQTKTGSQLWVYRDRRRGKWFLQGEF